MIFQNVGVGWRHGANHQGRSSGASIYKKKNKAKQKKRSKNIRINVKIKQLEKIKIKLL
jgi:hypothetical protein